MGADDSEEMGVDDGSDMKDPETSELPFPEEPEEAGEGETAASYRARGYLTRKDVAARYGTSPGVVIKWEHAGYLTPHKPSDARAVCYDPEEVAMLPHRRKSPGRPRKIAPEDDPEPYPDEDSGSGPEELAGEGGASMDATQALGMLSMTPAMIIKQAGLALAQANRAVRDLLTPNTALMSSVTAAAHLENERLRARCSKLEDKNWDMLEAFQKMLDNRHSQEVRERESAQRMEILRDLGGKVAGLAPLAMSYFGDKMDPNNPAGKEAALLGVVDKLSPEQLQAIIATGALDQVSVMTLISVKERRIREEDERLRKRAEAEGVDVGPDGGGEGETVPGN